MSDGVVVALASSGGHGFSKRPRTRLTLLEGLGVEGDAHAGETVKHRSRVKRDPTQPNLRQVHLIHAELFADLAAKGFEVTSGDLGENVTTRGIDLLGLPRDAILSIGEARIRITGLRNPCAQIEAFRAGLLAQMVDRLPDGTLRRKCGVMGIVDRGGAIGVGMPVMIELPEGPHQPLEPV